MITKIQLLRNIGQFDSVAAGANLPFGRLVLAYAENGRGKTTLAAVLRSLSTGDPIPLSERRRLSAQQDPHVVVDCAGGPPLAIFQGAWNRTLANVAIFDDAFVDANIYSGLTVDPEHRQRLHELVLGAQGVTLHRKVEEVAAKIETHNAELRVRAASVPSVGIPIDDFCALPAVLDVDNAIKETERKIAAVREQDPIRKGLEINVITLPLFDLPELTNVLKQDLHSLDADAAKRVQQHLVRLGQNGEAWLATGLQHVPTQPGAASTCPFCLQDLGASAIIGHYRAYFSAGYDELKRSVADTLSKTTRFHGGDVPAAFERAVRVAIERRQFWAQFCELPEVVLDTAEIVRTWRDARDAVVAELQAKQAAPLEPRAVPQIVTAAIEEYEAQRRKVEALNKKLQDSNAAIRLVKEQAAGGASSSPESDLARLKASKARHSVATALLCTHYLDEKAEKVRTIALREKARVALDQYRTNVFPTYQQAVNDYLQRFNAGFRIANVASVPTRSGSSCNYNVMIGSQAVAVAGGSPQAGAPSFRNTLSSGDRNTLALAFFFSSLDQDPNLATKTVVIDDPVSSLDEHRSLTTVQEIRRLAERVGQVIVLSHDKKFLARIWDRGRAQCTALQIVRDGQGSSLAEWNVNDDATTEYDRRHALLWDYLSSTRSNTRDIAAAIRPVLEGYVRVVRPESFPPGSSLGNDFLSKCGQHVGSATEIFDAGRIRELREILEYAHRFHHNTNPSWETETINEGELRGFVTRALSFVRR